MSLFGSLRLFSTMITPGPVGLPVTLNNRLWLRADKGIVLNGSTVQSWQDQSGNGYHFSNGTSTQQPTFSASAFNGKPGVIFDGVDDFLTGTSVSNIITSSAYTLFMVFSLTAVDTSSGTSYNNDAIITDSGGIWGTYVSNIGPRVIGYQWDGTDDHADIGLLPGHTYVLVQAYDGTNLTVRLVPVEMSNSTTAGNITLGTGSLYLGRGYGANYFNGTLHEVICYNDFKNGDDIGTMVNYLTNFWTVDMPLEDSTPYAANLLYEARSDRYVTAVNNGVSDVGDLIQPTVLSRPNLLIENNGMHSLQFGGSYLYNPGWIAAQPFTIYIVGKATNGLFADGAFISSENESFTIKAVDNSGVGGPRVSLNMYAGITEAVSQKGGLTWGVTRVACAVFDSFDHGEAYLNNNIVTFCSSNTIGFDGIDGIYVGSADGVSNFLDGDIKCIMIYDGVHDETERQEVMDFLNARYSIAYYGLPQAIPWTGWWRGAYEGNLSGYQWPPTLSARESSGYTLSADGMFAIAPEAGPGLWDPDMIEQFTSADFDSSNVLQTNASLSDFFGDGSQGSVAILFKSNGDVGGGNAYTESPLMFDNVNFSFAITVAASGPGVTLHIDTENEGVHTEINIGFTESQWTLVQFKWGDGNMYARVNSGSWNSEVCTGIANTTGTLDIGYSIPNALGFDGEILEVFVGDFFAPDTAFDALIQYVNARYDLSL